MQNVARWAGKNYKKICNFLQRKAFYNNVRNSAVNVPLLILTTALGTVLASRLLPLESLCLPYINAVEKGSLRTKFNFIGSVVKKCAPAVVYIEIQDPRRIDPETNEPIIISNGSGFIVRDDGWILTNAHVVISKPNAIIAVKLQDGSVLHATVEDADMNIDLALLKVNATRKLSALDFARSDDVEVGEWVIALGSPLSLSHSVTAGVISSTNRAANELGLRNHAMEYIQTDASITFGNSGGPLVNLDGDVIGINNLRITAGISFAIPIAYAKKFLRNGRHPLGEYNKSNHGDDTQQLGIATVQMTDIVIEELQLKENISGVFVWKVILDSPAFRSGLQAGDIITHVNGMTINQVADIYKKLKGGSVKLDIIRDAAINSERATLQLGQESVRTPSVCAMTDDRPYVQRAAKGRSASICAATSTSMEALPPTTGGTPDAGTPVSRRRRPATRSQSARITGGRSIRKRAAIVAAANNNAEVKSHCNSEPKLDQGEGTPEVSPNIRRKGSRRGTSVYHRKSAAFLDVPDTRNNIGPNEDDEDSYRLRSFSFTSKGKFNISLCV